MNYSCCCLLEILTLMFFCFSNSLTLAKQNIYIYSCNKHPKSGAKRMVIFYELQKLVGGFNQSEKICASQIGSFPQGFG